MKILYFGMVRDVVGLEYENVEVSENISSLATLTAWIERYRPAIGEMIASSAARVAVDERVFSDEDDFPHPSTIAIFPPLSGG